MKFTWDEGKSRANQRKHDVSFEDARDLFTSGGDYLELFDEAHAELEERFIAIGAVRRGLIVVVWTEQEEDTVRIISVRLATRREQSLYDAHLHGRQ